MIQVDRADRVSAFGSFGAKKNRGSQGQTLRITLQLLWR